MLKIILWAIFGWGIGYLINQLADFFANLIDAQDQAMQNDENEENAVTPADGEYEEVSVPFQWGLPGIVQFLQGERARKRPFFLELICIILFASLPLLIPLTNNLIVNTIHIAILILIMVVDLENKAVFGIVIYPAIGLALLGSNFVTPEENTLYLSLAGAASGFVIFWLLYKLAQGIYGKESGALGFGDVQISMLMGAMLGFHRIFFALILAMFLGGVISLFILIGSRHVGRRTALPYGQYLTFSAIILLIWGAAYYQYYWS